MNDREIGSVTEALHDGDELSGGAGIFQEEPAALHASGNVIVGSEKEFAGEASFAVVRELVECQVLHCIPITFRQDPHIPGFTNLSRISIKTSRSSGYWRRLIIWQAPPEYQWAQAAGPGAGGRPGAG